MGPLTGCNKIANKIDTQLKQYWPRDVSSMVRMKQGSTLGVQRCVQARNQGQWGG